METRREKRIRESIEMMFKGMDDDFLKEVLIATALNKSEEEKDAIVEAYKRQREEDEERFRSFEITDVSEVVQQGHVVPPATPSIDDLPDDTQGRVLEGNLGFPLDNIEENESDGRIWQLGKGHESITSEHSDNRVHIIERE
jgi:hypothetical protein